MPVYNGEGVVAQAIDSLLEQSFSDFELIISDNASTDGTEKICRDYAARDRRIRYVRQARNLGAVANFDFVLAEATAPFFMWAASDDVWRSEFVSKNLANLEADPTCVCSVSEVEFVGEEGEIVRHVGPEADPFPLEGGTFPLTGEPADNVIEFLEKPQCNTRYYGIHRRDVISKCSRAGEQFLASDWVVMARTLGFGTHREIPEVLIRRGAGGASMDVTRLILETNPSWLSRRWIPMWPMTRAVLFDPLVVVDFAHRGRMRRLLRVLWEKNRTETRHHRKQLAIRRRKRRKARKRARIA